MILGSIILSLVLASTATAGVMPGLLAWRAANAVGIEGFRVTFLTGATPTNIVLHASYAEPAVAASALYDSGDGNWTAYTSRTIPVVGDYVAFKGDWRNAAGGYAYMFGVTFQSAAYTCKFNGALENTPSAFGSCYREIFRDCTAVVSIEDNPLPILTGAPATYMFYTACYNMSGVTGALPTGFLDTSGLTGAPAVSMFHRACYNMSGVTGALPAGFLDASGLTGVPAASMFHQACYNMSGVTSLPTGFLDTSGLTGVPATYMFYAACYNMSGATNAYTFAISSNVTFDAVNVGTSATVGPLASAWRGMVNWPGTVMWGTNVLFSAIAPSNRIYSIEGSTNVPGYAGFDANWK